VGRLVWWNKRRIYDKARWPGGGDVFSVVGLRGTTE
jgi:hypothetical protein